MAEGRRFGCEETPWVRVEQGRPQRGLQSLGQARSQGNDMSMPHMDTIKIAQRDDRAAQAFGQRLAVVEKPHAARSRVTKL